MAIFCVSEVLFWTIIKTQKLFFVLNKFNWLLMKFIQSVYNTLSEKSKFFLTHMILFNLIWLAAGVTNCHLSHRFSLVGMSKLYSHNAQKQVHNQQYGLQSRPGKVMKDNRSSLWGKLRGNYVLIKPFVIYLWWHNRVKFLNCKDQNLMSYYSRLPFL